MEVLKIGKAPREVRWIKKCATCKSVLVYNADDVEIDMEGGDWITCPICKKKCYTYKNEFSPTKLLKKIDEHGK